MRALIDANIVIDHLNGAPQARAELERYPEPSISVIAWMEVLAGPADAEARTRSVLAGFTRIELDDTIIELAVRLRRQKRMRLPDAIILATAKARGLILVTRNSKDFPKDDPDVRIPYRL